MFRSLTALFHYAIGRAALSARCYSIAASEFRRSLAAAPQRVVSRKLLAWTLSALGDNERAVEEYQRVIVACPESTVAYHCLAFALQQLNRHQEALEVFQT